MIRLISTLLLALVALAAAAGCEKEVDRTQANMTGSWQTTFADVEMTINLGSNGTFYVDTEGDSLLFMTSPWGKLPFGGQWRLGEDELVFSDGEGVTVGGLEIVKLYANSVRFRASNGAEMTFERVAARNVPPPIAVPPAGDGDDAGADEGAEDEGVEDDAAGADGDAAEGI